ncbi:MAG: class I SAM-dependent methyltransferase [Planctomycetota bacterium]
MRLIADQFRRSEYPDDDSFWSSKDVCGAVEPPTPLLAAVHYGYTGGLMAKAFVEHQHRPRKVLDVGSGSGRWLAWYRHLGAEVTGVEVAAARVKELHDEGHDVVHADIADYLAETDSLYDTINAIGVIHHVLPDEKRVRVLNACIDHLLPEGVLVVGGFFLPWQVQYSGNGDIYKKCWPLRRWRQVMKGCRLHVYRNPICRWRSLPQNNILLVKRSRVSSRDSTL